jgi:hypothetical protein
MSVFKIALLSSSLLGAAALGGCTTTYAHILPDFGATVREDQVAQIANPDAKYSGVPAPGTNGQRVELAQTRYVRDRVAQPVVTQTTNVAGVAAAGGSGGDAGSAGPQ